MPKPKPRPILTVDHLQHHPEVFRTLTGLRPGEVAAVVDDLWPAIRAPGAGCPVG